MEGRWPCGTLASTWEKGNRQVQPSLAALFHQGRERKQRVRVPQARGTAQGHAAQNLFTQCIAAACDTWQDMPQRQGAEFEDIKPAWGADTARMLRWWGWEFHTTEWGQGEEPVRTAVTDGGGRDARRRTSGCGFGTYCGGAAEQFYWWIGSNLWQKQRRTGVMPRFWPEQSNDGNGHLLKGATSARNRVLCEEGGSFTFIWALLPRYVSR